MTVQLIKSTHNWIGLSSDPKPSSVPYAGSTFEETDTGKKFVYRNGAWVERVDLPYVLDPDTLDPVVMTQPVIKTDNLQATITFPSDLAKDDDYPAGSGVNGSVTLTLANTAYAVPAVAAAGKHVMVLYNGSDTDMYVGFQNSNASGILLPVGGVMTIDLGASQQMYAYCGSAGKVLTYSYKLVV